MYSPSGFTFSDLTLRSVRLTGSRLAFGMEATPKMSRAIASFRVTQGDPLGGADGALRRPWLPCPGNAFWLGCGCRRCRLCVAGLCGYF